MSNAASSSLPTASVILDDRVTAGDSGEPVQVPSDVADPGKIRLGGAFRLPPSRKA